MNMQAKVKYGGATPDPTVRFGTAKNFFAFYLIIRESCFICLDIHGRIFVMLATEEEFTN